VFNNPGSERGGLALAPASQVAMNETAVEIDTEQSAKAAPLGEAHPQRSNSGDSPWRYGLSHGAKRMRKDNAAGHALPPKDERRDGGRALHGWLSTVKKLYITSNSLLRAGECPSLLTALCVKLFHRFAHGMRNAGEFPDSGADGKRLFALYR